ncbi:hypothetical protein [Palleronia sp. LCG004]|uniref:hypothetical protein n=1 Tax=Palleronia sp. LCG004 TaxID=3079304 RepID=UPI002942295A|nr:hypothetical protein [Palleronia sp. LCG004]WOI55123.1 hypothetical protein RVY76_08620 [Palleronia sp. LCG004]
MDDERLIVALEARIRDFERNMAKAERQGTGTYRNLQQRSQSATRSMERDMVRSTGRINQALASTTSRIGAMGKAFAIGAVVTGVGALTKGASQAIRSLADLDAQARRAGVSVQAFQELKFVAETNRIEVDQLTDGLKELQLRADEFIETGGGSAAEAFNRLGYGARDLARRLKEPQELFLDLIGRMEDLDRAAQIRVADEVFGGTGGERFVELLSQGESGIRGLVSRAHELGAVMDDEAIAKAVELDRKFAEVGQRISSLTKSIVVGLADAVAKVADAAGSIGVSDDVEDIASAYEGLFAAINAATGPTGVRLMDLQDVDTARELADLLVEIDREMTAFKNGATEADAFEEKIGEVIGEARDLLGGLSDVDAAQFGGVISNIDRIATALAAASAEARAFRSTLPTSGSGRGGDPRDRGGSFEDWQQRNWPEEGATSPRPKGRPIDIDFGYNPPEPASGGGRSSGGGGGGSAQISDYQREIERTRSDMARLEGEAVELLALAQSGRDVGDALEYARKRAELLYEAQASGKAITPSLTAEIDALALSYTEAGMRAESAADKLRLIEENALRGADRMTDLFGSILDGSASAKDSLSGLLMEMARMQFSKAMLGFGDPGGVFGIIGGALTGRATGGPVRGGSPYLVNERTARSEVFVPSQSGGVLNVPQAQAALRDSARTGSAGSAQKIEVVGGNLMLSDRGEIVAQIRVQQAQAIQRNNAERDRALPGKVNATRANTHRRAR